jgi:hypothetical protein
MPEKGKSAKMQTLATGRRGLEMTQESYARKNYNTPQKIRPFLSPLNHQTKLLKEICNCMLMNKRTCSKWIFRGRNPKGGTSI